MVYYEIAGDEMTPPEDKAPDMPCCAHLRVTERHEENGGFVTRTWWECEMCRLEFTPRTIQSPDQGAVELWEVIGVNKTTGAITPWVAGQDEGNEDLRGYLDLDTVQKNIEQWKAALEQALTRPPLDLAGLRRNAYSPIDNTYLNNQHGGWNACLDHLQAIRPDLFGGK